MAPDPSEKLFHGNGNCSVRTSPPDFTDAQGSKYINNKLTVINNTFSHIHRNNHDLTVNKNGKDLLQLCRSLGLYIINGRLRGDTLGRFTFCSPLGNSTVDYMITVKSLRISKRLKITLKQSPVSCTTSENHTDGLKTALKNIRKHLAAKKYKR